MLAKRFFYVVAALFLLVLTYQIGATNADGQTPGNEVAAVGGDAVLVTSLGDVYWNQASSSTWQYRGRVTVGLRPVAVRESDGGPEGRVAVVFYENGDMWALPLYYVGAPLFKGNVFSEGATSAQIESWGKVKAEYRK